MSKKILLIFCLVFVSKPVKAQITPDSTLPNSSVVTNQANTSIIEGGTTKDANLFHSFERFSVPSGGTAYFNNSLGIQNIFSRVTGKSISNIDGLLRTNADANLFLINPNGIVFGPNASLNIGGSFLSSTASSINFADNTKFSADAAETTPLLTVSVPIGLGFGSNPGAIQVQGVGHNLFIPTPLFSPILGAGSSVNGLKVMPGKTLALVGGNINLEGGLLTAPGGQIELGSVGLGTIILNPTPTGWTLNYDNVQNFQDIRLSQRALADASGIGNSSIQLVGKQISLLDGSVALIQNQGFQPTGNVNVSASDSILLTGTTLDGRLFSGFQYETIRGNVGDILVSTKQLHIRNGAAINTKTFTNVDGADMILNASESIQTIGVSTNNPTVASGIGSITLGSGKSGSIIINTGQLTALDGGNIVSATFGEGTSGDLFVNATQGVLLSGSVPNSIFPIPSQLAVSTYGDGNGGDLTVTTSKVLLQDGANINSNTFLTGNAGNIKINATESVEVSSTEDITRQPTSLSSAALPLPESVRQILNVPENLSGNAGDVEIDTKKLNVNSRGVISVNNFGSGVAGNLVIKSDVININNAGIAAATASRRGGNISLEVNSLLLDRGNISATANDQNIISLNSVFSVDFNDLPLGDGGNITINTDTLVALENSDITANADQGRGGNIEINAQGIFGIEPRSELTPQSDITAFSNNTGINSGGEIVINSLDSDARNALTPLESSFLTTEQVVAGSCLARRNAQQGSFVVTGSGGLPTDPYSGIAEWDTLTGVQPETGSNLSETRSQPTSSQSSFQGVQANYPPSWKPGDPIIEAQGIVVTTDGRTSLGMEPQQATVANPETLICSAASPPS